LSSALAALELAPAACCRIARPASSRRPAPARCLSSCHAASYGIVCPHRRLLVSFADYEWTRTIRTILPSRPLLAQCATLEQLIMSEQLDTAVPALSPDTRDRRRLSRTCSQLDSSHRTMQPKNRHNGVGYQSRRLRQARHRNRRRPVESIETARLFRRRPWQPSASPDSACVIYAWASNATVKCRRFSASSACEKR
jgi:hypothetical protein